MITGMLKMFANRCVFLDQNVESSDTADTLSGKLNNWKRVVCAWRFGVKKKPVRDINLERSGFCSLLFISDIRAVKLHAGDKAEYIAELTRGWSVSPNFLLLSGFHGEGIANS